MLPLAKLAHALAVRGRAQGGYTLIELLVGFTVALIIAVAAMAFMISGIRQYQGQADRVTTLDETRNALMKVTSELRDSPRVTVVGGVVEAQVRRPTTGFDLIRYQCAPAGDSRTCTRTNLTTGGAAVPLAEGVVNEENFIVVTTSGVGSQGGSVRMRLELDLAKADNPVVLETDVRPRSCFDEAAWGAAPAGLVNQAC